MPLTGHVTYVEFFCAQICAMGGIWDDMSHIKQFETIYKKYVNDVYRVAMYLVKDENKAQDIVRQVFASIYKQWRDIEEQSVYLQLLKETKRIAQNERRNRDG